ncbi:MAG: SCO family protein [Magnetospirillum sp. WYHS-4]
MKNRIVVYGALVVVLLVVALAGKRWLAPPAEQATTGGGLKVEVVGGPAKAPAIGGPFALTDHDGRAVTDADYRGRFMLIFFGYTFCPDVCPTNLSTVAQALDILGPAAERIVPLFISVDPQRDTVEKLKEFVGHFHPRLVGLTGTNEQVVDAARKFRVYYAKVAQPGGGPDDYLMDHGAITYLMGPDGAFRAHFPHGTAPEQMAARLRDLLAAK